MTTTALDMSVLKSARRYGALSVGARMLLSQSAEMAEISRVEYLRLCAEARRDNAHKALSLLTEEIFNALYHRATTDRAVWHTTTADCQIGVIRHPGKNGYGEVEVVVATAAPVVLDADSLALACKELFINGVEVRKSFAREYPNSCGRCWDIQEVRFNIGKLGKIKPETIAALVAVLPALLFENA